MMAKSPVSALDAVLDAARALERAETVMQERLAKDRVRMAINLYDSLITHMAEQIENTHG